MKFRTRTSLAWLCVSTVVVLSGCAVAPSQQSAASRNAASASAALPPGQVATALRRSGDKWILAFGHTSRVADLGRLNQPRVVHATRVGNATTAMLRVNWQGCDNAYVFVGVPDNPKRKVDRVRFDHACSQVQPVIQTGHTEQYIDFIVGNRVKRYIYNGDELEKDREVVLRPGQKLPPPPGADGQVIDPARRYRPGLAFRPTPEQLQERPVGASVRPPVAPAETAAQRPRPARSGSAGSSRAELPTPLSFPAGDTKSHKPIDVDLTH